MPKSYKPIILPWHIEISGKHATTCLSKALSETVRFSCTPNRERNSAPQSVLIEHQRQVRHSCILDVCGEPWGFEPWGLHLQRCYEDEVIRGWQDEEIILTQSPLHQASCRHCTRRQAILSIHTAYGQSQRWTSLASRKLAESQFEPDGHGYQLNNTRK